VAEVLLALAAVVAGVTGAWSPCSLSAAETLRGALPRAAFALGALGGGLLTFAGLAAVGAAAGFAAPGIAAAVAIAAAAGEACGARVLPQVRRQVPESWRRILPLPLAGGAYGVLLGLGWTTFVLTYAVWALAAICVALGDTATGLAVGAGFGVGRALPVLAGLGSALAERPRLLRRARLADGVALAACALALGTGAAQAQSQAPAGPAVAAEPATEPSATGAYLAWQEPGAGGVLQGPEGVRRLPGRDPVVAGAQVAWRTGDTVTLADVATLAPLATVPIPGATAFATDGTTVVHRAPTEEGGDGLFAGDRLLHAVGPGESIGRPAMAGGRVLFHAPWRAGTRILAVDAGTGAVRTLRQEAGAQLLNPAFDGDRMLYVRATATRQRLKLGPAVRRSVSADRTLWSTWPSIRPDEGREPGQGYHRHYPSRKPPKRAQRPPRGVNDTLWTTALGPATAYVTRLRQRPGQAPVATLLALPRPG
jgi:hypothetical protein